MRQGDEIIGVCPCQIHVVDGQVRLGEIQAMIDAKAVPTRRHVAKNLEVIMKLDGKPFHEFFVTLFNYTLTQHTALADKVLCAVPHPAWVLEV